MPTYDEVKADWLFMKQRGFDISHSDYSEPDVLLYKLALNPTKTAAKEVLSTALTCCARSYEGFVKKSTGQQIPLWEIEDKEFVERMQKYE